jgi:hypothetical protein
MAAGNSPLLISSQVITISVYFTSVSYDHSSSLTTDA